MILRSLVSIVPVALALLSGLTPVATLQAAESAEPPSETSLDAPAPRTLYWIRHGHYDWEEDADPEVGKALVPVGVAQARLVAARLRAEGVVPDRIVASPMTRARQTAWEIAESFPGLAVEIDPVIRECTPPTRRADVMEDVDLNEARACAAANDKAFESFFRPANGKPAQDVIVAHGNVIRRLVTRALDVDPESWLGMSIGNCSLTVFRIAADGAIKMLAFSDVGHLPNELRTGWDRVGRHLTIPDGPPNEGP